MKDTYGATLKEIAQGFRALVAEKKTSDAMKGNEKDENKAIEEYNKRDRARKGK